MFLSSIVNTLLRLRRQRWIHRRQISIRILPIRLVDYPNNDIRHLHLRPLLQKRLNIAHQGLSNLASHMRFPSFFGREGVDNRKDVRVRDVNSSPVSRQRFSFNQWKSGYEELPDGGNL